MIHYSSNPTPQAFLETVETSSNSEVIIFMLDETLLSKSVCDQHDRRTIGSINRILASRVCTVKSATSLIDLLQKLLKKSISLSPELAIYGLPRENREELLLLQHVEYFLHRLYLLHGSQSVVNQTHNNELNIN